MDLSEISSKVKSGEFHLADPPSNSRGEAWKVFRQVQDEKKSTIFGVACCKNCFLCLYFKKMKGKEVKWLGISNLIGHLRTCKATPFQSGAGIKAHFKVASSGIKSESLAKVKHAETKLVNAGFLPFSVVEQPAFKEFAAEMVDIGSKYGNVDVGDVLYGRKTLQSHTLKLLEKYREVLALELEKPKRDGAVALVSDLWTDGVVQNSYLDVTAVYLHETGDDNSNWAIKCALLQCKLFPMSKTAENIEYAMDQCLEQWKINPKEVPITTDAGANIVKASAQKMHFNCICHRLHTAVEEAWKQLKANCEDVKNLDEFCHKLVSFAKQSANIQDALKITLKHGGETRPWRALVKMFHSIKVNMNDDENTLAKLLRNKNREFLLTNINQVLLEAIHEVLAPMESVFDMLEHARSPTLQNVVPLFYFLRNQWSSKVASDLPEVRILKSLLVTAIDNKIWTSLMHVHFAATFLDPTLNSFNQCGSDEDRKIFHDQAVNCLKEFCYPVNQPELAEVICGENADEAADIAECSTRPKSGHTDLLASFRSDTTVPNKKRKEGDTLSAEEMIQRLGVELRHYKSITEVEYPAGTLFNPLAWWGKQTFRFPVLSLIAKRILVIPASSSQSERNFSAAGKIGRKERARLSPRTLEAQVLLHHAFKQGMI